MAIAKGVGKSYSSATYVVPDDQLAVGSTLGGPKVAAIIKATGALQKVFNIDIGETLFDTVEVRHYDDKTGVYLEQAAIGTFVLHAEHQEHLYYLANGVHVRETIFVLSGRPGPDGSVDPPGVYYGVELTNEGSEACGVQTYCFALPRGTTPQDVLCEYDQNLKALVFWNESHPDWVRILGASDAPLSVETTLAYAMAVRDRAPGTLSNATKAPREPMAVLQHRHQLQPGQSASWYYLMSMGNGRDEAEAHYKGCPSADEGLDRTQRYYASVLAKSVVMTPDESVNRGVLWAKANMLRVESKAPTGWCFTNDPTRSNNSVGRDTAWFALGADYLTPEFARDSLLAYSHLQEQNGMMIEYYDIRNGKTEDYGLNINDNTPLLIMAFWHHYHATGDRSFLETVYPHAVRAARYILSQRNQDGLVWSNTTGVSDWGIVGWRNVIPNYTLSGATTEINSECCMALETVSRMARVLEKHDESAEFEAEHKKLKEVINKLLLDPADELYYLNIDVQGSPHAEVTSDLVFPVMFDVAPSKVAANIVAQLSSAGFWTQSGMRTTPRDSPTYDPEAGWGLRGGVWVGVSFWYAFAAAPFSPDFMAYALSTTFHNYSSDPRATNTVPGQFSEWLNGETLVNQGMMLSPWFPPRYLWAAIEGMAGLSMRETYVTVTPHLAANWKWLAVHNVPYRDRCLTWFAVRTPELRIYGNFNLPDEGTPHTVYAEDITHLVRASGDSVCAIGLREADNLLLFAGNTVERTVTTFIGVDAPLSGTYHLRAYNSLLSEWIDWDHLLSAHEVMTGITIELERTGFWILDVRQVT